MNFDSSDYKAANEANLEIGSFAVGAVYGTIVCLSTLAVLISRGEVNPELSMTYPEFAATLLTAVAVIVTCLGVGVAILAVWGYRQLKVTAKSAAINHVKEELRGGKLDAIVSSMVETYTKRELTSDDFKRMVRERVEAIAYSGGSGSNGDPLDIDDSEEGEK